MYFTTIFGETGTTQVVLPKPSMQRPMKPLNGQPQQPVPQQQQTQSIQQANQVVQMKNQQQIQPQQNTAPVGQKLNAATMNKRQIPNGSKNTVNPLRQAQQPLNIRK